MPFFRDAGLRNFPLFARQESLPDGEVGNANFFLNAESPPGSDSYAVSSTSIPANCSNFTLSASSSSCGMVFTTLIVRRLINWT